MLRTWSVRFDGHGVDGVGEVLPGAGHAAAPWPGRRACRRCRPRGPRGSPRRRSSRSWSTMALTVRADPEELALQRLASISSAIFCVRSPSATAPITRATSIVGRTRSSTSALIESIEAPQDPVASSSRARSVIRPSRPMIRPIRTSSAVSAALRSARRLNAASIRRSRPAVVPAGGARNRRPLRVRGRSAAARALDRLRSRPRRPHSPRAAGLQPSAPCVIPSKTVPGLHTRARTRAPAFSPFPPASNVECVPVVLAHRRSHRPRFTRAAGSASPPHPIAARRAPRPEAHRGDRRPER